MSAQPPRPSQQQWELVSFDVQETLTGPELGDAFWTAVLPELHARRYALSFETAARALQLHFELAGTDRPSYYDAEGWLERLGSDRTLPETLATLPDPVTDPTAVALVERARELPGQPKLIALSSTTRAFIERELSDLHSQFDQVISTFDDLGLAGKPPEAFEHIARSLEVDPPRAIHIGNDIQSDVRNARAAGWSSWLWTPHPQSARLLVRKLGL